MLRCYISTVYCTPICNASNLCCSFSLLLTLMDNHVVVSFLFLSPTVIKIFYSNHVTFTFLAVNMNLTEANAQEWKARSWKTRKKFFCFYNKINRVIHRKEKRWKKSFISHSLFIYEVISYFECIAPGEEEDERRSRRRRRSRCL